MRLKVSQQSRNKHERMVTAVGWTPQNELFSVSDDKTIVKWGLDGEPEAKVTDLDVYATDLQWFQTVGANSAAELFALGCSNGTFRLMSKTGRVEKSVEAHTGAITALCWNYEGTALATAGEDGFLKQWSRTGNLRSKLAQSDRAIYSLCWSPDNQSVMYCSGPNITIKPLQVSSKQVMWKAHEGTILKIHWNPINNLVVSGGEDCRYKVWDSFGRQLYGSKPWEYPITSVSWCPSGEYFAVGSFNMVSLCDKTGWSHSRSSTESGSLMAINWTSDGTQLAGAGGNGAVVFGQIVDRTLEWRNYEVKLNESNQVIVQDVLNESSVAEELEFGDRVVEMSMGHGHLIVATAKTCYVYSAQNFSTPHIFDLRGTVNLILQSDKSFMLVDNAQGIQIYTYEGRQVCSPRPPSLAPELLKAGNASLSGDCLAIIDRADAKQIHLLDTVSGKPLADPIKHELEVVEVALNQSGLVSDRKIIFVDRNRDMFISQVHRSEPYKLATMVDTVIWNDENDILAAVSDSKLLVWYYPHVVWVDKDLVTLTRASSDASAFGKMPQFVNFFDSKCTIRRADGALQTAAISPFPALLYKYSSQGQWSKCTRLCRFVKDPTLWACLAAMALHGQQLDTAEAALAAIDEVDKLTFVQRIKSIPSPEAQSAELLLYRRRTQEAENVLLQAQLFYRAIDLNIRTFQWERALDLALKYKTHVDTVLAHRQQYLEALGLEEQDSRFLQYAQEVPIDRQAIQAKKQQEIETERERYAGQARGAAY